MQSVDVAKAQVIETGDDSAVLDTELTYYMKDGRVSPENLKFWLVWDAESQQWLIDKTRRD